MATLHVRAYDKVAAVPGQKLPVTQEPGTAMTPVTFTTSAQSAAFGANTKLVRVIASANCYLEFGVNPVATAATGLFIPANTSHLFGVYPGHKVAAYDGSS